MLFIDVSIPSYCTGNTPKATQINSNPISIKSKIFTKHHTHTHTLMVVESRVEQEATANTRL